MVLMKPDQSAGSLWGKTKEDRKMENRNSDKKVKIALFYWESDYCWQDELAEIGCPHKDFLPDFESRKSLAEWFMSEGMKCFAGEKDGIMFFKYRGDWYHTVAVINLDISRPWTFTHSDDPEWPWERIMYLDHMDSDNRIYPEIYPALE